MIQGKYRVYIGCYGTEEEETIHIVEVDCEKQSLQKIASFNGIENPSFITVNQEANRLYAISEVEQGKIWSLSLPTDEYQEFSRLHSFPTYGGPCYIELDNEKEYLFTANYGNGSVIVHKLDQHGNMEKETDYHAIQKEKDNRSQIHMIHGLHNTNYYLATDIAKDKLYVYQFFKEKEALVFYKEFKLANQSGPRHLAYHPHENVLYIVNEYQSNVFVYQYDNHFEKLTLTQVVPTIPSHFKQKNYGAHIQISANGKNVFVSNRGHHSITHYRVQENGKLKRVQCISIGGEWPRHFQILPDGKHLLVANEHTNQLVLMRLTESDELQIIGESLIINKPVCIHSEI